MSLTYMSHESSYWEEMSESMVNKKRAEHIYGAE